MFAHYLSTALRHLRQHKGTTIINVLCLTFGLVAFLLAWGSVTYLQHADHYHERAERTVVLTRYQSQARFTFHLTPSVLSEYVRTDFPELESIARVSYPQEVALTTQGKSQFASIAYVDAEFLRILDLPLVAGSARTALDAPRSAIIGADLARTLFGTQDVIGRSVRVSGHNQAATITGIVGDIRRPSHLAIGPPSAIGMHFGFEILMSMDMNPADTRSKSWESDGYFTYAVLPRGGVEAVRRFDAELEAFSQRRVPAELRDGMTYGARPLSAFMAIGMDAVVRADVTGVDGDAVILALGVLVLAIACLNYTNLATAIAMSRAKETALRRVVGASRTQLMTQHIIEAGLLTLLALAAALGVVALIALAMGRETFIASVGLLTTLREFWIALGVTTLAVALVSSLYPALSLSKIRPAHALRGGHAGSGSRLLATLLVGCQFAASSFLMIATFVLVEHYTDTRTAILSSTQDPLLTIANDLRAANVTVEALQSELMSQPGVEGVSAMHRMPWSPGADSDGIAPTPDVAAHATPLHRIIVAPDFFATLQIPILAGRVFERSRASDVSDMQAWYGRQNVAEEFHVVVDDRYLPMLGAATPADAIDRVVYRPVSADGSTPPQRLRIIGVVAAGSVMPLTAGTPGMYFMDPKVAVVPIVRISRHDTPAAVQSIDHAWQRLAPDVPIKRRFADEQFDYGFGMFATLNRSLGALATFACLIAVVGLVGMALHVTRRRQHEIGVRKTLGADVPQILTMLLRNFLKPVAIANLAVWPLVYLLMAGYLSMFSTRTQMTLTPFAMSLIASLLVACLAVGAQAFRAARLRPAEVLRCE